MKELTPIRTSPSEFDEMFHRISDHFRDEIYLPLMGLLGRKTIRNTRDDLLEAIRVGNIFYLRGVFSGNFNSTTSRELRKLGAKWKKGTYRIALSNLPIEVKNAISSSLNKFEKTLSGIDRKLSDMNPAEIADRIKLEDLFDKSLWKTQVDLNKSMKAISVGPELTDYQLKRISEEYTNDMKRYIKDFTEEEITKLRRKIQKEVVIGNRYEGLIDSIKKSYGVSVNKAKFLARQETHLMLAKFKETRYSEAGVKEYKWRCVSGTPLHPVRPMHKKLDGKIFRWDDPPVTSENGDRNNPGQDYNCRCIAIPIVKFK